MRGVEVRKDAQTTKSCDLTKMWRTCPQQHLKRAPHQNRLFPHINNFTLNLLLSLFTLRDSTIPKGEKRKNQYKKRKNSPFKQSRTPDTAPYTISAMTEKPTPTKIVFRGALFVRDKLRLPATNNKIFEAFPIPKSIIYKLLKNITRKKAHVKEKKEKRERAKLIPDKKIDKMISLLQNEEINARSLP